MAFEVLGLIKLASAASSKKKHDIRNESEEEKDGEQCDFGSSP